MTPFPPIFAYVIFGIVWLIQVILTLLVITIPAAEVVSVIETILLIFWMIIRVGPGKTFSKFSSLKKNKKFIKRFTIQTLGELIPIINLFPWAIWFIYNEYKQELKEFKNKELGITDDAENTDDGLLQKAKLASAMISPGAKGITTGAVGGSSAIASSSNLPIASITNLNSKNKEISSLLDNPQSKTKDKSNMTISEEIGGVKTGLNKEDYDSGIKNYGDFDTYTKENKENEENKRQKQEEARKNDEAKRIQGIKADQDLRTEMLDTAKRRYGENSDEAKRGKEEEDSNHSNDDYREII